MEKIKDLLTFPVIVLACGTTVLNLKLKKKEDEKYQSIGMMEHLYAIFIILDIIVRTIDPARGIENVSKQISITEGIREFIQQVKRRLKEKEVDIFAIGGTTITK